MYEQLDGILACRDLIPASSVKRGSPGYLYIGPRSALSTSTWALCTSTWALQTDLWSQEMSKRLPGPILERFRTPLGGSRSPKTL